MAKNRLNPDEAFENIIGRGANVTSEPTTSATEEPTPSIATNEPVVDQAEISPPNEKLIKATFYITEKHRKALKIRTALGNRPEDKDQSSIVRAALDAHLTDRK